MTTCADMTFERLLAHVDEPTNDLTLIHHVAFCDRCSARVLALRVQSLALAPGPYRLRPADASASGALLFDIEEGDEPQVRTVD